MILLAIDLYGIEPFRKPTRIPIKPGLNIVTGANGAGKTAVRRVLASLLLGTELKGVRFVQGQPAQAAVILQAKDNGTYRITADYLKGIFNLSRLEPSGQKTLIEKEQKKITGWVCEQSGGMREEELSALFLIDRIQFPSVASQMNGLGAARPDAASGAFGSTLKKPLFSSSESESVQEALTPAMRAEKEKQAQEIRRKLEEMAKVEEEMLNTRDKASDLKRRLNQLRDLDFQGSQLTEAEEKRFSNLSGIEAVRPDLIRQYETAVQNKQNELTQLEEQKQESEGQLAQIGETDFFQDRQLRIGAVVMVAAFLLPFVVTLQGPFRYLFPIGVLAGISLSLFSYLQLNRRITTKKVLERKWAGVNEKIHSVQRKFDKEYKEVIDLFSKIGCKDVQEFKDRYRSYQQHLQRKKEITEKRETLLKGETVEAMEQRIQEIEAQVKIQEDRLQGYSGLTEELYRLEESLRHAASPPESPEIEMPDLGPVPMAAGSPAASSFVQAAISIGKQKTSPLSLAQIEQQSNILYSLFKQTQNGKLHLKENGEIKADEFGLDQVSSGTADQIFLSFLLATLDQFSTTPFPLVLDEPFSVLASASQETALELLRGASKRRQVLLFTVHSLPTKNTDHAIKLGES